MIDLRHLIDRIGEDLGALGTSFAIVGGIAVSVRSEPRFTRDVDLAAAVGSDAAAERLVSGLVARGWSVVTVIEQEAVGRLAAVRLRSTDDDAPGRVADLLFASSGIEHEIVAASEEIEVLPGLFARVARVGHLIALKVLAESDERPQDRADIVALLDRASPEDRELARTAAALIEERGYGRGRSVVSSVERWLGFSAEQVGE